MKINELVSLPISLTLETVIDGEKFYSSDHLKEKFILAFEKSSKGKHIANEMKKLVEKKLVIPCYKSKNLLGFIKRKISRDPNKFILGFYHIKEKRVIILIENSVSLFGTSANNALASTTMHECMHLIAGKDLNAFKNIFKPDLEAFYTEFIKDYLKVEKPAKADIDKLIDYITVFEKRGPSYVNSKLKDYVRFLYNLFSSQTSMSSDDFQKRLSDIVVCLKLFILSITTLLRNINLFQMFITSLKNAYFNAFGSQNNYTTPLQELMSISEVACVLAEMEPQKPVIRKLFQIIA
jgi:hypothetical protein